MCLRSIRDIFYCNIFDLRAFTSPQCLMSGFNFHSYLLNFTPLVCLPIHFHFVLISYSLPFDYWVWAWNSFHAWQNSTFSLFTVWPASILSSALSTWILVSTHLIITYFITTSYNSLSTFALLTSRSTECKESVFLQFCVKIQSSIHQIFTRGTFHRIFTSLPLMQHFPMFNYRPFSFCCFPIFFFFFITALQVPSKGYIYKISIGPVKRPHTLVFCFKQNFLFGNSLIPPSLEHPQKVHAVSIDPDIPPLREFGL